MWRVKDRRTRRGLLSHCLLRIVRRQDRGFVAADGRDSRLLAGGVGLARSSNTARLNGGGDRERGPLRQCGPSRGLAYRCFLHLRCRLGLGSSSSVFGAVLAVVLAVTRCIPFIVCLLWILFHHHATVAITTITIIKENGDILHAFQAERKASKNKKQNKQKKPKQNKQKIRLWSVVHFTLKKTKKKFYKRIVPMGFLPWKIRVTFPGESQLRQTSAT